MIRGTTFPARVEVASSYDGSRKSDGKLLKLLGQNLEREGVNQIQGAAEHQDHLMHRFFMCV